MKKEQEQIGILLRQNESQQLEGFNWDGLNTAISNKLNQAENSKTSTIKFRSVFKVAAGVAAVAAVIFIAVMIKTDMLTTARFKNGQKAVGTFVLSQGSAKVKILDSNAQDSKDKSRSSWIIIRTTEPKVADNGQSRDDADFACLM